MVCADHYEPEFDVCVECAAESGAGDEPDGDHPDVDRHRF